MINVNYNTETPRIMYGDACFLRICPECSRYVKADAVVHWQENGAGDVRFDDNATCKKHGRIVMPLEGYFG